MEITFHRLTSSGEDDYISADDEITRKSNISQEKLQLSKATRKSTIITKDKKTQEKCCYELREVILKRNDGITIKQIIPNYSTIMEYTTPILSTRSSSEESSTASAAILIEPEEAVETMRDLDTAIEEWRSAVDDLIREERTRTARATTRAKRAIDELVADTLEKINNDQFDDKVIDEVQLESMVDKWREDMKSIRIEENQRSKRINEERRMEINDRLQRLLSAGLTEEAGLKLLEIGQRLEDVLREEKQETGRALEERDEMEVFTEMKVHQIRLAYANCSTDRNKMNNYSSSSLVNENKPSIITNYGTISDTPYHHVEPNYNVIVPSKLSNPRSGNNNNLTSIPINDDTISSSQQREPSNSKSYESHDMEITSSPSLSPEEVPSNSILSKIEEEEDDDEISHEEQQPRINSGLMKKMRTFFSTWSGKVKRNKI